MSASNSLFDSIIELAAMKSTAIDPARLAHTIDSSLSGAQHNLRDALPKILTQIGWRPATSLNALDPAQLPLLVIQENRQCLLITECHEPGLWRVHGQETPLKVDINSGFSGIYKLYPSTSDKQNNQHFADTLRQTLRRYRSGIGEAIAATFFINLITAVVSLFSLQVYDKVIPSRSTETLTVLFSGVVLLIIFEWLMKYARSQVMNAASIGLDSRLSRLIFERLLSIRLDKMPSSVGSLASQLRSYEQIRSFYTGTTLFALVDLPAALIFIGIIASIATTQLAMIPLLAASIALVVAALVRRRINRLAQQQATDSNAKTGLLVETVEGVETIKATKSDWKFLDKWLQIIASSIMNEQRLKSSNELFAHFLTATQQLSYVCLITFGALSVIRGDMSMGALIACSILGGRTLSAVLQLPNLLIQHAHAQAASAAIERLYECPTDNQHTDTPLTPSQLQGNFFLDQVSFSYPDCPPSLRINRLTIKHGERIALLGTVGSGKSTLLKLLSGLYAPSEGRVLIERMDIQQIARQSLAKHLAYIQQDARLFSGTLRENLQLGLPPCDDDRITQALRKTGLAELVASHPKGLELPIHEGGRGLSGGQKQLLVLTRLLLQPASVLLLDEPTSAMDERFERQIMHTLLEQARSGKTLILTTHKLSLLKLVTRVIVLAQGQIVLDGPRDEIIKQLQTPSKPVAKKSVRKAA